MLTLGSWALLNRPAEVPGFTGEVAGLAFSPVHRGESPQENIDPTIGEMRTDLPPRSTHPTHDL